MLKYLLQLERFTKVECTHSIYSILSIKRLVSTPYKIMSSTVTLKDNNLKCANYLVGDI